MNRLISELSVYRDDLHENFMRYYKGDTETVRKVENGIYQVYLRSFDLNGDAAVRVPFRVNAAHKASFEKIYEEKLQKYNIDITNYVRTLLGEYAIKPYYQRELFFHYRFFKEMQQAISRQNVCRYTDGEKLVKFIPAAVEPFFPRRAETVCWGFRYPTAHLLFCNGGMPTKCASRRMWALSWKRNTQH